MVNLTGVSNKHLCFQAIRWIIILYKDVNTQIGKITIFFSALDAMIVILDV